MINRLRSKLFAKWLLTGIAVLSLQSLRAQTNYQLIKSFGFPDLSTGANPGGQLIRGNDGELYGVAQSGGAHNDGSVYKMKADGSSFQVLHSFAGGTNDGQSPGGALLQASDGLLYGTTYQGGSNSVGTVYVVSTNGTGYAVLRHLSFLDGDNPFSGLIEGREDGSLYGTTSYGGPTTSYGGTVFKMNKDGSGFTVLANFNNNTGAEPKAPLLEGTDGNLYGVTVTTPASVFKVSRNGGIQNLHFFNFTTGPSGDGGNPVGQLTQGTDGFIYGTTVNGGLQGTGNLNFGNGTIFKISTNFTGYQVIYRFAADGSEGIYPNAGVIFGSDGNLYGENANDGSGNQGVLYRVSTNGGGFTVLYNLTNTDGNSPMGGLLQTSDGSLYGTAPNGGSFGDGTAFKFNPTTSTFAAIHQFVSGTGGDGASPSAALTIDGNVAYGTTTYGGSLQTGTLFKINLDGTGYTLLHDFTNGNNDGQSSSPVIKGADGNLYGTLPGAGTNNYGAIFKVNTNGSNYVVLYSFGANPDGNQPSAALVQGKDGALYGVTETGGSNGLGTIFKIQTDGSGYSNLYSFQGYVPAPGGGGEEHFNPTNGVQTKPTPDGLSLGTEDGASPQAPLIQGQDGMLYGTTTAGGGQSGDGTVFKIAPDGSGYASFYTFQDNPDGASPLGPVVQGPDGTLYGTTEVGGDNFDGAIFSLDTNGLTENILYSFGSTPDGENPQGALVLSTNGVLYGTTASGGNNNLEGTVFALQTNGSNYTVLHIFTDADANTPKGGLALAADGTLYGTGYNGGAQNFGGIFKLFAGRIGVFTSIPVQHSNSQALTVNFSGGVAGQTYSIQASDNALTGWQTLGSSIADTNGVFQYSDTDSTNHSTRFYRSFGP